jgi:hypothetical protein
MLRSVPEAFVPLLAEHLAKADPARAARPAAAQGDLLGAAA